MAEIITARHVAARDGCQTQKQWIERLSRKQGRLLDTPFTGMILGGPVLARVDFGRWIADCPDCGGAEYVDPREAIFYCFQCGNRANGGHARPVAFPPERERLEIEALLLERDVDDRRGRNRIERALMARPAPLPRNWTPGERPEDLRWQNEAARAGAFEEGA